MPVLDVEPGFVSFQYGFWCAIYLYRTEDGWRQSEFIHELTAAGAKDAMRRRIEMLRRYWHLVPNCKPAITPEEYFSS